MVLFWRAQVLLKAKPVGVLARPPPCMPICAPSLSSMARLNATELMLMSVSRFFICLTFSGFVFFSSHTQQPLVRTLMRTINVLCNVRLLE